MTKQYTHITKVTDAKFFDSIDSAIGETRTSKALVDDSNRGLCFVKLEINGSRTFAKLTACRNGMLRLFPDESHIEEFVSNREFIAMVREAHLSGILYHA